MFFPSSSSSLPLLLLFLLLLLRFSASTTLPPYTGVGFPVGLAGTIAAAINTPPGSEEKRIRAEIYRVISHQARLVEAPPPPAQEAAQTKRKRQRLEEQIQQKQQVPLAEQVPKQQKPQQKRKPQQSRLRKVQNVDPKEAQMDRMHKQFKYMVYICENRIKFMEVEDTLYTDVVSANNTFLPLAWRQKFHQILSIEYQQYKYVGELAEVMASYNTKIISLYLLCRQNNDCYQWDASFDAMWSDYWARKNELKARYAELKLVDFELKHREKLDMVKGWLEFPELEELKQKLLAKLATERQRDSIYPLWKMVSDMMKAEEATETVVANMLHKNTEL